MASRRFFPYDDDYYYYTPYNYPYPYYHTAPARDDAGFFFPDVESVRPAVHPSPYGYYHQSSPARAPERHDSPFFPGAQVREPSARVVVPKSSRSRSVSVPVHGPESELGPEREAARLPVPAATRMAHAAGNKKREPSVAEAAVRVQAAARGFMARRMMREVRAVEREAEGIATRMSAEAEAMRGDARARVATGEKLMRLLLRLDAVRGVREYRRRVTKRVLALQDAVDALERPPAPVTDTPAAGEDSVQAETVEMTEGNQVAEESEMAPESPNAAEKGIDMGEEIEAEPPAAETAAQMEMEVDEGRASGNNTDETELVVHGEKGQEAEGEWEMVTEEDAVARENPAPKAQQQALADEEEEEKKKKTQGGAHAADGLDARKVLEMVTALCEQSAQQCAVIGALAERVDTLERAVRRVEEADRRRRRNKKKLKEGKGNSKAARSCYSD